MAGGAWRWRVTAGRRAQAAVKAANAAGTVTAAQVLDGHVTLDLECLDRVYLNGYVPNLQVGGQVVTFLTQHLGNPIPSPALFNPIGERFRAAVTRFAAANGVPVVRFDKDQRKAEVMRPYLEAAQAAGRPGVVAVGVAQEFQRVFSGSRRKTDKPGAVCYGFEKADRRVSCYYFYVWDAEFGPGFIKICSYFPYPIKVWVNGHEWAKRQAAKQGVGFTELANGFATTDDPERLQAICDALGPTQIQAFFDRWTARLTRSRSSSSGKSAAPPRQALRPAWSPAAWTSPSTASTSTPASSNTSRRAARSGWRLSATRPPTWGSTGAWSIWMRSRPERVRPTGGCWTLNGPARAVSLRAQPLRGSHSQLARRDAAPERCASAIPGSWPWPAPCRSCSPAWSGSPTGAFAPRSPPCSAPPTRPTR